MRNSIGQLFHPGRSYFWCCQVSAEIDARKRDGRLGQRARDLNRLIEPSIETGGAVQLVEQPVRVDIAYVAAGPIDWTKLDDFERDSGDDRIVAQALHALIDDPGRIEVLSFDSRPRAAARRHGAGGIKPDESWLLDLEPSPSDRRVAELERRVRLLQESEPQLRVVIRMLNEPPLVRFCIPPAATEKIEKIVQRILAAHPRKRVGGGMMTYDLYANSTYDEEYGAYAAALRDNDVPNLHLGVARQFSQYGFEVSIENIGALAAEHVAVEFRSGNAVLHSTPYSVDIFGPPPPSTRREPFAPIPYLSRHLASTDRTGFEFEESRDPNVQIEYRCQDFRHGRTQKLTAVLELIDRTGEVAHLEVRVTAGNMRGEVVARLVVSVVEQEQALDEMVDFDRLVFRKPPPIKDVLLPMLQDDADAIGRYRNDGTRRN